MGRIYLNINGREVSGFDGQTILDIAAENGIFIPTLCNDERVKIYGSCGICVVESEGSPRLLRACSTVASDGMVIFTETNKTRSSRRAALELLLSDHTGDCRPPCALACPAGTDCQGYVGLIANGEFEESYKLIRDKIPLPGAIGRVCPHPCETACRRKMVEQPISIAALKTFAAESQRGHIPAVEIPAGSGKSVAIIGGGPGGLSAAYFLRLRGHAVTIYDAMPHMGGMLRYGIPEYRLPKAELQLEIDAIADLGVTLCNNIKIGRDITLEYLRASFDAVIIAVGAWSSTALRCEGEKLDGVYGGIDFLRMTSLGDPVFTGANVAVVGGGNTAMDACRTLARLGAANVYNIYRRTKDEMPAQPEEIHEAEEEGVIFKNLRNPLEIIGTDGRVSAVRLQVMELGEPDASGRRAPVEVKGEEETISVDTVIIAIGQRLDAAGFEGVALTDRKNIAADAAHRTNLDGVFAIGDAINKGADIAISAIGHAKVVAASVDAYLAGENYENKPVFLSKTTPAAEQFASEEKKPRIEAPLRAAEVRKSDFLEIRPSLSVEAAQKEAARCLECGCQDYFECKLLDLANRYDVSPERFAGEVHHRRTDDSHPFIKRNVDKCILCGLCARACEEVVGETVYGLVGRGFDTLVDPAGVSLFDAGCISCGLCIDVCPTGALLEVTPTKKQVPLKEKVTHTTCTLCGALCRQTVTSNGNSLLRAMPDNKNTATELLCAKGRFGFHALAGEDRITRPMIRVDGKLTPVSYEEAIVYTNKRLQALQTQYGKQSIAVSVSGGYTNEDILLIREYANNALHTQNVFSFSKSRDGIGQVLGYECSTAGLEELRHTDCILLVESELRYNHITAGLSIRKAVERGAKLIIISSFDSSLDSIAAIKLTPGCDLSLLGQIAKAAAEGTKVKNTAGYDELTAVLADVSIGAEAKTAAEMLLNAKNAVIVFEQDRVSADTAKLLADLVLLCGFAGKPRSGILRLTSGANAQGLVDLSVGDRCELRELQNTKKLKGLFVFGEDVLEDIDLSVEFLAVQETHLTKTAQRADVVFPAQSIGEIEGSVTGITGDRLPVRAAVPSPIEQSHFELLINLSRQAGYAPPYRNAADLTRALNTVKKPPRTPAKLMPPIDNKFLRDHKIQSTNAVAARFAKLLNEKKS